MFYGANFYYLPSVVLYKQVYILLVSSETEKLPFSNRKFLQFSENTPSMIHIYKVRCKHRKILYEAKDIFDRIGYSE
ncbi:hypothetical protein MSj_04219 [Microcystis aeruginosa Sj]|uniref:Uncharacterized protein n=1 Tax=Microcystis aeruginosa Sj TaxID=1979544 RepID=A0A2Z6UUW6_MICAE|nr:hypothetical protein MSj_04219 [Microcystis aeruginosa Sj]